MKYQHPVHPPRGSELSCKGWIQEAAKRMLLHNLDPDNAEVPEQLIVYGGRGKAARTWEDVNYIIRELERLENDETLLVQSGRPVGVFRTHENAPRVLIANSNLVPRWATWEHFDELDKKGLMMYGQMTAGSWIYIGTQGILQGTYETFAALARKHFGQDSLKGKLVLTGGLGGMGGAQPLSVTFNEGVAICVEVDKHRIDRRLETRYLDTWTDSLDEAIRIAREAQEAGKPLSVGLLGNTADVLPDMAARGIIPDVVTDQTSAHDELYGYVPNGLTYEEALKLRESDPVDYKRRSMDAMVAHCRAIVDMQKQEPSPSTMATICEVRRRPTATKTLSSIPDSCLPISATSSARARARSVGWHSPATLKTSTRQMPRSRSSSPRTRRCTAGSTWHRRKSPSRGCRVESAGWGRATATRLD